ncbi:threonine/serine exporter ThrE family protein [Skermania sp. ID1734]|uniref:threonine/serine ThrE exporter family protein n=1 Tax=Skermania sp. ID1734 TaxID=2597516 RepID=UPI001C8F5DA4|nr:threonine/serine exporter family protein [Skermania sp. ID1734]
MEWLTAPTSSSRLRDTRERFRKHRQSHLVHARPALRSLRRRQAAASTDPEPQLPDDATVNLVLDLALRIGEIQMYSGAGASDVTATILAVTRALGLTTCQVDVILTSITVTCHRGSMMAPVTTVRVVRSRSNDYSRLTETENLVNEIVCGRIDARAAQEEVRRISRAPHPYPKWVAVAAWGGMAGFITVILGGGIDIALSAVAITIVVDRMVWLLSKVALPQFFQQVAGGAVATFAATAIASTGIMSRAQPTLLVAAALTVLLSGLATVSAVQDAITGYNVTAAGRTMEIVMMSVGLITGVLIALKISLALGFPRAPLPEITVTTGQQLPLMMFGSVGAAGCFALASYSRGRAAAVAAIAGGLGGTVYGALALTELGAVGSAAVAALLVGIAGGLISRRLRITPLVTAVSGITPMVPGLLTYRGMYELGVEPGGNAATLVTAAGISIALAAGVVLGEYLAQPFRIGLRGLERKLAGPRMAGPLRPEPATENES